MVDPHDGASGFVVHGVDTSGIDLAQLPKTPEDPLLRFYQPMAQGNWVLRTVSMALTCGYWTGLQITKGMVVLMRRNDVWMSISPMESESQQIGVDCARGHVAIFGLGMGWVAGMTALRPEVEKVTIVEMDEDVLAMHQHLRLFEQLPDKAGEKVAIVEANALDWKPDSHVDLLMPDIWLDMVSWGRPEEVHDMQDNVGAEAVYFWGQELEIARHAAKAGTFLDDAGIAEIVAKWDLPLVGLDTPDYAERTQIAARQWMKGRWLEGTEVPEYLRNEADELG